MRSINSIIQPLPNTATPNHRRPIPLICHFPTHSSYRPLCDWIVVRIESNSHLNLCRLNLEWNIYTVFFVVDCFVSVSVRWMCLFFCVAPQNLWHPLSAVSAKEISVRRRGKGAGATTHPNMTEQFDECIESVCVRNSKSNDWYQDSIDSMGDGKYPEQIKQKQSDCIIRSLSACYESIKNTLSLNLWRTGWGDLGPMRDEQ